MHRRNRTAKHRVPLQKQTKDKKDLLPSMLWIMDLLLSSRACRGARRRTDITVSARMHAHIHTHTKVTFILDSGQHLHAEKN